MELVTLDGDLTLYDDGQSLMPQSAVIPRILKLIRNGTRIGIVTAAGYTEAHGYYERLHGLLTALHASDLPLALKQNLVVIGGESSYCFKFAGDAPDLLRLVPRTEWVLDEMLLWEESDITELLDIAEASLRDTVKNMRLAATVVRKEKAVGIVPQEGMRFSREALEETVLIAQKILVSRTSAGSCARIDPVRKCRQLDAAFRFALSTVRLSALHQQHMLMKVKAATTSSLTLETSHGACWPANASLVASRAARRCISETSFSRRAQTTSRRDWPARQHGSRVQRRPSSCWTRLWSWTRCSSERRGEAAQHSWSRWSIRGSILLSVHSFILVHKGARHTGLEQGGSSLKNKVVDTEDVPRDCPDRAMEARGEPTSPGAQRAAVTGGLTAFACLHGPAAFTALVLSAVHVVVIVCPSALRLPSCVHGCCQVRGGQQALLRVPTPVVIYQAKLLLLSQTIAAALHTLDNRATPWRGTTTSR